MGGRPMLAKSISSICGKLLRKSLKILANPYLDWRNTKRKSSLCWPISMQPKVAAFFMEFAI
jgi:hypothetical protein